VVQGVKVGALLAGVEATLLGGLGTGGLAGGATLVAPETVFLAMDTTLGRDVVVEPNVVFGPGVTVGEGAHIRAFSHLDGATVAAGAIVGPFARLRPGADIGVGAHIGNFVEVKATTVGEGAKINHLTYVGDAKVGARANLGAGTITCNYDGFGKFLTEIGAGAFIGSNSALVAPIKIGAGAYVGSGSVVTDDVPADALALGRGRQVVKEGWAARFRAARAKAKRAG
jgi:bifunctional UDP-N-acetylglucosamine pyrophosphorylase/glucosamine-1-phosphate N-acetyltransferase